MFFPKVASPHDFTVDQLNEFFSSVSHDPLAPSIDDYLTKLQSKEHAEFYFLEDIDALDAMDAVNHFTTQARGQMASHNVSLPLLCRQ